MSRRLFLDHVTLSLAYVECYALEIGIVFFFELDPETKIYQVGYVADNGNGKKRYISVVREQGGTLYAVSGSRRAGDCVRYVFTPAQSKAFDEFVKSREYEVEYWEGIS